MDRWEFLREMRNNFETYCKIENGKFLPFNLDRNESGLSYKDPIANLAFSFYSTGYQQRQSEVENNLLNNEEIFVIDQE